MINIGNLLDACGISYTDKQLAKLDKLVNELLQKLSLQQFACDKTLQCDSIPVSLDKSRNENFVNRTVLKPFQELDIKPEPHSSTIIMEEIVEDSMIEICQTCGLEFGNKAVLKIHNSLVHPEENKDDQNSDLVGNDPFVSLQTFDNSKHVSDSVQENCNRNKNNAKHDVETIEKIPTILEETEIQMQEPDAHCEESAKLNMDTSVHEKKKPFKCDICDYNFFEKGNLKRHTDSVHEGKKPYKCSICDKRCSLKAELKEHIEIVHEKKKPHKCPICDYKCAKKGNLNTHVASVHEKKKPHKCSICDFSCSQQSQLKRHIYSVHEKQKPHQCLMCDKSFSQLSQLKTHTDSVHENLKPYECSICDYSCSRKNDLKRHIKRNHIFSDDLYGLY